MTPRQIVDYSALRVNQCSIVTLTALGFILDAPLLPAFTALVLVAGTITPKAALFKLFYTGILRPLGIVRPDPVEDSPAPHQFAQLLGGIVLGTGVGFILADWAALGWGLAWVVIVLALANLLFGFCAGCFIFYQVGRLRFAFRTRPGLERGMVAADLLPGELGRRTGPVLLYFWNVGCAQCAPQERQIEEVNARLRASGGSLNMLKLNAHEEERLARVLHVITVPTTVILDPEGRIAAANAGLTPWQKLLDQWNAIR